MFAWDVHANGYICSFFLTNVLQVTYFQESLYVRSSAFSVLFAAGAAQHWCDPLSCFKCPVWLGNSLVCIYHPLGLQR